MNSTFNIINYFPFTQNIKLAFYDDTLIFWKKIEHYRRQKENSVRGRQMSIYIHVYSDPFYRSKSGHTFPCQYGKCIFIYPCTSVSIQELFPEWYFAFVAT